MKQRPFTLMTAAVCLIALTATAGATPEFRRAEVEERSAADGLKNVFAGIVDRADEVVWIGYAAPQIPGHRSGCGNSRSRSCVCKLEREISSYQTSGDDAFGRFSGEMLVLYRVEDNRVERIRMFSDYCTIDADDLTVYWLTDVDPSESIALLESFVDTERSDRRKRQDIAGGAVCAIAMHDDPGAFAALERFVQPDRRESLRESAVFWIGETGGAEGVKVLQRVLRDDPSTDIREHVTFALTLSDTPEALETLIDAARHDHDSEVREQAIFWLSQEASEKATDA
ncbi:MAG TPA: HEAT repeat domain-containing protein, partial [Acidobacteriota bacterium]|nr:HEAT repeat domain-containing protein [Acidobacteriota bacterium]